MYAPARTPTTSDASRARLSTPAYVIAEASVTRHAEGVTSVVEQLVQVLPRVGQQGPVLLEHEVEPGGGCRRRHPRRGGDVDRGDARTGGQRCSHAAPTLLQLADALPRCEPNDTCWPLYLERYAALVS